jgi:hypothetical protein
VRDATAVLGRVICIVWCANTWLDFATKSHRQAKAFLHQLSCCYAGLFHAIRADCSAAASTCSPCRYLSYQSQHVAGKTLLLLHHQPLGMSFAGGS